MVTRTNSCRMPSAGIVSSVLLCGVFAASLVGAARAQAEEAMDFANPTGHFRVPDPATLSDADAASIYDRISDDMVDRYRLSRQPVAARYRSWPRFNRTPYRSATHGERYINNYANPAAAASYGRNQAPMSPGAVLAKDSFTVTALGEVFTGPLFLMEKMAPGFSLESGDWRYTMIMPDGSLFGTTDGAGRDRMAFCAACHQAAGADNDFLFFVPEAFRIRSLDDPDTD